MLGLFNHRVLAVWVLSICAAGGLVQDAVSQTLVNDLNGTLTLVPGGRPVPTFVTQIAFKPGDNNHVYVATAGGGVLRYDYDPNGANGNAVFSNQQTAVPTAITNVGGVNGSLGLAFHEDPTLGTVMYIAPAVPFVAGGSFVRVQTIVRLTDVDNDGVWGEAGELNQTIVNSVAVTTLHEINQMRVVGDTLYVNIGIRTQNGGQTAAQNQAIGGTGVDQSDPGETAYTGCLCFIEDLTLLSNDTTTTNIAGFTINGISAGGTLTNDDRVREDIQPFISTDPSKLRNYSTGFRNNYGLGIDDDGEIWVSMNQNENPNAQDQLHRGVTFKSDNEFFKGNDRMGDWKTTGDEATGSLTVDNLAVLNAGWFDPGNSNPAFSLLGFNVSANGMAFYPSDFPNTPLAGDVLVCRNSGGGSDIIHVDEATGGTQLVVEGLAGALDIERDPFGNFIAGGSTQLILLRVDEGDAPPPPGQADAIHLSLGEEVGAPGQEILNGDTWNNLVGSAGTDNSLQYADGSPATGISATQFVADAEFEGNNPNDAQGAGYVTGLDSATTTLIFSGGASLNGQCQLTVNGLPVGSEWTVLVYAGLNDGTSRQQTLTVNGTGIVAPIFSTYNSGQPVTFSNVVVGQDGQIQVTADDETSGNSTAVTFIQAVSLIPVPPPVDPSAFVGAHLAYGGGAFGEPETAFRFYPYSDGALFGGPNDDNPGEQPFDLFGGSGLPVDPSDGVLNIDELPAGTYSFLFQENNTITVEYEFELITVQAPGSSANPPTNDLTEAPGVDSISSDYANPSNLTLGLGSNIISGEVGESGIPGTILADGSDNNTDGDYFTITVPDGLVLDQMIVNQYNNGLQRGFLIYAPGSTLQGITAQNSGIAADKQPLLGGETATFANYSSYSRGINRVLIDIDNLPNDGADLTASDFEFRVGNDDTPDSAGVWPAAPAPSSISVLAGGGDNGSDRVVISWPDNAIDNTWLQVSVKANNNTALPEDFTLPTSGMGAQFYFGNAIGESGSTVPGSAPVNFVDVILTWIGQSASGVPITSPFDYNRDGMINITDVSVAWLNRAEGAAALQLIMPPGPMAQRFPQDENLLARLLAPQRDAR